MTVLKLVTFNIRCIYNGAIDGANSFIHRGGMILDVIGAKKPDVICFQEAVPEHIRFLRKHLVPEYTVLFTQRENGLTGEGLAVAYRQDTCSLYGLEVFWLSPTPQVIASKFPGQSKHSRIGHRLWFKNEQTGNQLCLYNLHLEEISEDVRVQHMDVALSRADQEGMPTLIMGDLNSTPGGKVISSCCFRGYVDLTSHIPVTFHGFGKLDPGYKLDYFLAKPETAALCGDVHIWDECYNGIYLSDHYPVELTLDL